MKKKISLKRFAARILLVASIGGMPWGVVWADDSNPGSPGRLSLEEASRLAQLPLDCIQTEYPNKLGQVLGSAEHIGEPRALHPAFYGCFDWHSSVHGHWTLVSLLKRYPDLPQAEQARRMLAENISVESISKEIEYFQRETEKTYERTYGWAWLLKLAEELHGWNDPLARKLEAALQPLVDLLVQRYIDYYPRLVYPIRVGEHTNTAFGAAFAWDYGQATGRADLLESLEAMARRFYGEDRGCPIRWEPSGYDFLSPCLEEIDLMRRVLSHEEFLDWSDGFLPELSRDDFQLEPGRVLDRSDGKLVHLDGLNFSRAWVFYGLANRFPELAHLRAVADEHVAYSLPNLVGDSYEGGHWLASFALYALNESKAHSASRMAVGLPDRKQSVFVAGMGRPYNFNGIGYDGKPAEPSNRAFAWDHGAGQWIHYPDYVRLPTMDHRGLIDLGGGRLVTLGGLGPGQRVLADVTSLQLSAGIAKTTH